MANRILIVDDEQPVRHMLNRMLVSAGFEVLEADDGLAGLALAEKEHFDLVITDLKMPQMDGLTMAQKLLENNADRPVLLMTAYADVESARRALKIGIYEYFLKPVDMNDLLAGITRALERRDLLLENRAYQKDLEKKVIQRTQALRQKVVDLEARDELLRQLLSIQEPEATLGLAVKLAAGLCNGHFGALYTLEENTYQVRAAFGYGKADVLDAADLAVFNPANEAFTEKLLGAVEERKTAVVLPRVDALRTGFGMGSIGMLPICKGEDLIAFLEVGRKKENQAITRKDMARLESFLPYVAMAVDDCILQDTIPDWTGDVDGLLDETEKWTL